MSRLVDAIHCMRLYRHKFRRFPNLIRPQSFNEKMQVAKLTWRSPLLPILVDKVRAKALLADAYGAELVTPNLYVGDWLPPRAERNWPFPYVIKPNHSCGANIYVHGPQDADWDAIESRLEREMQRIPGSRLGEWAYREVPRKVLVEPFLGDGPTLKELKFFVFGGRVAYVNNIEDRFGTYRSCVYDREWMPQTWSIAWDKPEGRRERPAEFELMVRVAEDIGRRLPFVRVDFYDLHGRARFGEITIYSGSGLHPFQTPEIDRHLGELWPKGKPADRW